MTDLEQAAAELRAAVAAHDVAIAEEAVHESNIEKLQALSADYRGRRELAALGVRRAKQKLLDIAAPKKPEETTTP